MSAFADTLIDWQAVHGRHDLPWQAARDPYRVWLSEIMLQQTQVDTVIPYYHRFLARFPDLAALAGAAPDEVMAAWSGLGYYARARNLHRCAQRVMDEFGGRFPRTPEELARLPGIGRSTAAAIAVFSFGARAAILDGNVKRVLCRCFGIDAPPGQARTEARLWALADALLPVAGVDHYIQALMDLGATVCTRRRSACGRCPLHGQCVARREGRVDDLPAPRPARIRPHRRTRFLILRCDGHVLLIQRPATGVWGGLWVPPEVDDSEEPGDWLRQRTGSAARRLRPLPSRRHEFTHFTLEMQADLADVDHPPPLAGGPGWHWLTLAGIDDAPLPAPVRRILAELPPPAAARPRAAGGAGEERSG